MTESAARLPRGIHPRGRGRDRPQQGRSLRGARPAMAYHGATGAGGDISVRAAGATCVKSGAVCVSLKRDECPSLVSYGSGRLCKVWVTVAGSEMGNKAWDVRRKGTSH